MLGLNFFENQGESLSTRSYDGYVNYRTRIIIEKHVENDPVLKCRNYLENFAYSKCLEERYFGQILSYIGCIPPWFGGNKTVWCNSSLNHVTGKVDFLVTQNMSHKQKTLVAKYILMIAFSNR